MVPALCVQYTPLSVAGLISSTLLQGNRVHGHVGLCAGFAGPHGDFLECQAIE